MLQFGYDINQSNHRPRVTRPQIKEFSMSPATKSLNYKGHPLRRKDNILYYGDMSDKYIIMLQILETKKVSDLDVASRVSVQLQLTDPDLKSRDRVVKKTDKSGLYSALDVASVWLNRALGSN